jgi:hypothetical protein
VVQRVEPFGAVHADDQDLAVAFGLDDDGHKNLLGATSRRAE